MFRHKLDTSFTLKQKYVTFLIFFFSRDTVRSITLINDKALCDCTGSSVDIFPSKRDLSKATPPNQSENTKPCASYTDVKGYQACIYATPQVLIMDVWVLT